MMLTRLGICRRPLEKRFPARISGCVDVISGRKAFVFRCAHTMTVLRTFIPYTFAHCDISRPISPAFYIIEAISSEVLAFSVVK